MTIATRDYSNTVFSDGVTADVPFTFPGLRTATLGEFVVVHNVTQDVLYTFGADYTVTFNASDVGGTVTFTPAVVATLNDGDELEIYRSVVAYQLTEWIKEQDIPADTVEFVLDKLTVLIQQVENSIDTINNETIPALQDDINAILDLSGTVLKDGTPTVNGIATWSDDDPATLGGSLVGTDVDDILKWDGTEWVASAGIPTLDLGAVVVPGATDQDGIVIWDATDGTALETVPPGTDYQVLQGNTGAPPSFDDIDNVLGGFFAGASADDVLIFDGAGGCAPGPLPDAPALAPAFFSPTARPVGLKYWGLASPGAYGVGAKAAKVVGAQSAANDAYGSLLVLTTTGSANSSVYAYTSKDDVAATRNAMPIWLTRVKTGADISNVRIWAGFNKDKLTDMRGLSAPSGSTAAFRYATDVDGTAFWRCVVSDSNGTATTFTTTVAIATNTAYVLGIDMTESGHVKFYIDGVEVADLTTNLPDATDELDWLVILRNLAASARSIGIGPVNMSHR